MGRPSLGPRLYLRRDGDKKTWIIRNKSGDSRTGLLEHQKIEAMRALAEFKSNKPIPPKPLQGNGLIYFVTSLASEHYPIKIGWSATGMNSRLLGLQGGNPNLLTCVATFAGTHDDERSLHAYFRHLHVRGEWFRRGDDLLEYIGEIPGQQNVWGIEEFMQTENVSVHPTDITVRNRTEDERNDA